MEQDEVRERAIQVVVARDTASEARAEVRAIEERHEGVYNARRNAIAAEQGAEQAAKDTRLAWFYETGERGEVYGLGVQMRQALVYEAEAALDWLIEHRRDLLKFDARVFEQVALAGLATGDKTLGFVTRGERPTAYVVGDRLAAAIRADDEAAALAVEESA